MAYYNKQHYPDPTVGAVVANDTAEQHTRSNDIRRVVNAMLHYAKTNGYIVNSRIELIPAEDAKNAISTVQRMPEA